VPNRDIQSWRDNGYHIQHLFRTTYTVIDCQDLGEFRDPPGLGLDLANLEQYDSSWICYEDDTIVRITLLTAVRFVREPL
jgi:hypothetical protein